MSERKVLNKYYPPNFDPSRIPKRVVPKDTQHVVRLMLPFSMRCATCGEYIYKGRKFNARKEPVPTEDYLGIKVFRFYVRCTRCAAEITFKTDPKNADYVAEHGATRNVEPWRDEERETEAEKARREFEEMNNPMKALENRTMDSKKEMDTAEALDEIRCVNARLERVDTERVFEKVLTRANMAKENGEEEDGDDDDDERRIREAFQPKAIRLNEEEEEEDLSLPSLQTTPMLNPRPPLQKKPRLSAVALGIIPKPKTRPSPSNG